MFHWDKSKNSSQQMFKKRTINNDTRSKRTKLKFDEDSQNHDTIKTSRNKRIKGLVLSNNNNDMNDRGKLPIQEMDFDPLIYNTNTATYEDAFKKEEEKLGKIRNKKTTSFIKPPKANLITTILTDYQPDVCKDFKQTGYCGYGDSCKFLHSRDDFKAGWSLNYEWKIDKNEISDEKEKVLKNIPFKCILCKDNYKDPVVTKCGHYFCSKCFIHRSKKVTICAICDVDTHGVAKVGSVIKKLVKEK